MDNKKHTLPLKQREQNKKRHILNNRTPEKKEWKKRQCIVDSVPQKEQSSLDGFYKELDESLKKFLETIDIAEQVAKDKGFQKIGLLHDFHQGKDKRVQNLKQYRENAETAEKVLEGYTGEKKGIEYLLLVMDRNAPLQNIITLIKMATHNYNKIGEGYITLNKEDVTKQSGDIVNFISSYINPAKGVVRIAPTAK